MFLIQMGTHILDPTDSDSVLTVGHVRQWAFSARDSTLRGAASRSAFRSASRSGSRGVELLEMDCPDIAVQVCDGVRAHCGRALSRVLARHIIASGRGGGL
jgi:hypothetical protein